MASGSGLTLDKVTIQIQAASKDANTNIRDLSKTLRELKDATKGGFNNLKKLADAMKQLNSTSKQIPKTVENLEQIKKVTDSLNKLSSISTPRGLKQAIANLEKLPSVFAAIDTNVINNVEVVSTRLAASLEPLAVQLSKIGDGLSSLSTLAKNYGVSITKVGNSNKKTNRELTTMDKMLKLVGRGFRSLTSGTVGLANKTLKPLKKLQSKIKQIGLSLLGTRTIFTLTRKAVSEYMAMDQQLTNSIQNTWRALGAQLAPAIEFVMHLFKQFVRVIYSIVYALTGIDLIARANARAMGAMGKSAKDALGSLQKFDDLNVAEFDKGSGDIPQIELDKIDLSPIQEVIDWMRKLKEEISNAWKTGEWDGVAKVLADGINGAINSIDAESLGKKITNVLTGIPKFITTMISEIKWNEIGIKIRESIENIDWNAVFTEIVNLAIECFKGLKDFVKGLFNLDEQDWDGLITAISAVGAALTTWKISSTFNSIVKSLEAIGILGSAKGITTIGLITIAKWMGVIALATGGIVLGVQGIIDLFDGKVWEGIQKILVGIALILAGIALAVNSIPILIAAGVAVIIALIVKIVEEIVKNWDKIKTVLGKVWKWVKEHVIDPIVESWNNFWKIIELGFKGMINGLVILLEGLINGIIWGMNWLIKQLNKIKFKVPDWVPGIGGKEIGVSIGLIDKVSLPKFDLMGSLAVGTNKIEDEGPYYLHQGEAVVPKKYNQALGNGTNEETNQRLDTLIYLMENMNFTNVVNLGNETLYKKQQAYNKKQNDKYGTTVNL